MTIKPLLLLTCLLTSNVFAAPTNIEFAAPFTSASGNYTAKYNLSNGKKLLCLFDVTQSTTASIDYTINGQSKNLTLDSKDAITHEVYLTATGETQTEGNLHQLRVDSQGSFSVTAVYTTAQCFYILP